MKECWLKTTSILLTNSSFKLIIFQGCFELEILCLIYKTLAVHPKLTIANDNFQIIQWIFQKTYRFSFDFEVRKSYSVLWIIDNPADSHGSIIGSGDFHYQYSPYIVINIISPFLSKTSTKSVCAQSPHW